MAREYVEKLLSILGEEIGLPGLKLDEYGYCCIILDNLAINMEVSGEELFLYANVGDLPVDQEQRNGLLAELLDANYFWQKTGGGVLAVSKGDNFVLFLMRAQANNLGEGKLRNYMENFANVAATWMAKIAGNAGGAASSGAADLKMPGIRV